MADIYDGPWRLFDHDPATGRTVWVLHEDGMMHFRCDYPVESIIAHNAEHRAAVAGTPYGEIAHVASIPLNVFHDSGLAEASKQDDRKFIAKYLNDSDNRAWRTREGKV
jgi:hypothetical protein